MKKYDVYNLTTGELLAYDLVFDDVPELVGAYADFFPDNEIIAVESGKEINLKTCVKLVDTEEVNRKKFYSEWFDLMDELLAIDNIH